MKINLVLADIVTALNDAAIGSRVTDRPAFLKHVDQAIREHDFTKDRVPGQGFILVPHAVPYVAAGVGQRSVEPEHYVCRVHRGIVGAYLKREHAAKTSGCAVVVYTLDAYLADPDITPSEAKRVTEAGATHVLVAVLAFAGPESPPSPYRLVWNLGGGNNEAAEWTADEIRAKAKASIEYDNLWVPVAD